jgi:putative redox protein
MDTSEEGGGRNLGPRPMETILSGVVACTTYDVLNHLRIKKQEVDGCKVKVNAERAETDPKIFKKIHMHFTIEGAMINEEEVKNAIELSKTKYGSGYRMLSFSAVMSESFEVYNRKE